MSLCRRKAAEAQPTGQRLRHALAVGGNTYDNSTILQLLKDTPSTLWVQQWGDFSEERTNKLEHMIALCTAAKLPNLCEKEIYLAYIINIGLVAGTLQDAIREAYSKQDIVSMEKNLSIIKWRISKWFEELWRDDRRLYKKVLKISIKDKYLSLHDFSKEMWYFAECRHYLMFLITQENIGVKKLNIEIICKYINNLFPVEHQGTLTYDVFEQSTGGWRRSSYYDSWAGYQEVKPWSQHLARELLFNKDFLLEFVAKEPFKATRVLEAGRIDDTEVWRHALEGQASSGAQGSP